MAEPLSQADICDSSNLMSPAGRELTESGAQADRRIGQPVVC